MKIENSSISMVSARSYSQYMGTSVQITAKKPLEGENSLGFFQNYLKNPINETSEVSQSPNKMNSIYSLKLILLRRIFDSIAGRGHLNDRDMYQVQAGSLMDLRSDYESSELTVGTLWQRTMTTSTFFKETEATTFSSTGYATTLDGRTISFGVELSLSRSFTAVYDSFETVQYIVTDPLMIDVGNKGPSVTDMKFLFDLDCDGEQEEISFAGQGNGFLALDINGDGVINDGSELFGTKTGNGFADLSKYDEDNNGWIDENDDIFSKLKIWTKDENGKDQLINLLDADIGAIYLGSAPSQYSLTNSENYTNAIIKSSGIFLRESGGVGTIHQLDLTS